MAADFEDYTRFLLLACKQGGVSKTRAANSSTMRSWRKTVRVIALATLWQWLLYDPKWIWPVQSQFDLSLNNWSPPKLVPSPTVPVAKSNCCQIFLIGSYFGVPDGYPNTKCFFHVNSTYFTLALLYGEIVWVVQKFCGFNLRLRVSYVWPRTSLPVCNTFFWTLFGFLSTYFGHGTNSQVMGQIARPCPDYGVRMRYRLWQVCWQRTVCA